MSHTVGEGIQISIKRDLIASSHHIRIIHLAISSRPSATARFATEATEFAIRERTALASLLCDESNISPSIDTRTRVGRLSRSGLGKLAGLQFKQETSSSVRGKKERKNCRVRRRRLCDGDPFVQRSRHITCMDRNPRLRLHTCELNEA